MRLVNRVGLGRGEQMGDAEWLARFMDLHSEAMVTMDHVVQSDEGLLEDGTVVSNVGRLAMAVSELYPVLHHVKKLPTPKSEALCRAKTEFREALRLCEEACLAGIRLPRSSSDARRQEVASSIVTSRRAVVEVLQEVQSAKVTLGWQA